MVSQNKDRGIVIRVCLLEPVQVRVDRKQALHGDTLEIFTRNARISGFGARVGGSSEVIKSMSTVFPERHMHPFQVDDLGNRLIDQFGTEPRQVSYETKVVVAYVEDIKYRVRYQPVDSAFGKLRQH